MTKNMTRSGLAFGAAASMIVSGFAALPASAEGIANDYVVIADTQEYGNYNMLTTGYIDLSGSFAGGAATGGKLKFYVSDPDAISVFDNAQQGTNADTVSTPSLTAYAELDGATDQLVLGFASATGIENGDAIDGAANLDITGATAAAVTLLKSPSQVASVKEKAATAMTSYSSAVKSGSSFEATITLASHGISVGDVILIASSTSGNTTTDTKTDYDSSFNGYHVVTSVTDDTFTFTATVSGSSGTTAQTDVAFAGGTVAVHNVRVNMNNTTSITADSGLKTSVSNGTITELTDADALDTLANLRVAKFGAAGVVGNGGTAVARSTTAATINNYVVDTANTAVTNGDQVVRFGTTADDVDGSIVVTAWVDNDGDDVIDSTEYVSDPVTVTFVEPSSVSYSISQSGVYIGSSSVTGKVTADLNLAEVGAQSLLELSTDHNDAGTIRAETDQTLAFNTTYEDLRGTEALTNALAAGDSIRFAVESANVEVGAASTFGVGSLTVAGSAVSVPATVNNTRVSTKDADGQSMSSATVKVRKGTATVTGTYTAYDGNPTDTTADKVVGNVPYTMSITSSAVTAADGVKLNGKVVDGGTETITGYTDANGQIALSLTQTAADASDTVTVSIDVQGKSVSGLVVFQYEAANYYLFDAASELTASTDYNTTMAIGGTYARNYIVADQFGVAPANGTVVLAATRSGSRTTLAADWSYQVPVVDGKATVTIVDNGKGTGSDTVTVTSYPLLTGGGLDTSDDSSTFTLTYAATAADVTPAAVTAAVNYDGVDDSTTDDKPVALEPDALVSYDSRATKGANPPSYETYNVDTDGDGDFTDAGAAQLTFSGTVSNATGGVVPGALVTISGQGVGFSYTTGSSETVYAVDSITVRAGAAGTYSVNVYGGTGGLKTLTATTGAATASKSVTFVAGGAVSAFTLTAPAVSEPGKTVDVSVKLTDKYGNPVQGSTVTLSSTGPGYLLNTTGTTLKDGSYNTKLLVGSNDSGTAVITATVTIAGVEVTKTASVKIGFGLVDNADQKLNAGSFNGYVAVYAKGYNGSTLSWKIAGKWFRTNITKDYVVYQRKTVAVGQDIIVSLYIDGFLKLSKTVTTR